jgi:dihydrofolate reductase
VRTQKRNARAHKPKAGVEIRVNNRLHERFQVAHHPSIQDIGDILVIGSFDFNSDCLSLERYDIEIITENPDLVKSAFKLFREIWNDSSSVPLDKAFPAS